MSKLSFRPRALEISKPLPLYMQEELPDLPEYSAINRAVPQLPSGMDKEEECEHHLQRAIVTGLIIPTPEVEVMEDKEAYDRLYPANYKPPRQLIHMQPFSMEEDVPDYDIDSEDEIWLSKQKLNITPLKFEEMMDRLEKNCAQNFASQNHKELLLKSDDEVSIAVFDYWLSKRLAKKPLPLVPTVRTEANNRALGGSGSTNSNNPYLAFRRRTEKMQTRKIRKNDEMSYEKMLKLKRDLMRALQLLDLVKKRENTKKELIQVTIQMYEKRYEAQDFSGSLLQEVSAYKSARPAFTPLYQNQFPSSSHNHHAPTWAVKPPKEELSFTRKEKRQYKKRKHKSGLSSSVPLGGGGASSADEEAEGPQSPQHAFPFHRTPLTTYHEAIAGGGIGNWPWAGPEEGGSGEERYRFSVAALNHPKPTFLGLVRRRVGRGGRVILDRTSSSVDDFWSKMDYTILDNFNIPLPCKRYYRAKTPPEEIEDRDRSEEDPLVGGSLSIAVESLIDSEVTNVDFDLGELFPELELAGSTMAGPSPALTFTSSSSSSSCSTSTSTSASASASLSVLDPRPTPVHLQRQLSLVSANGPLSHHNYGSTVWTGNTTPTTTHPGPKWSSVPTQIQPSASQSLPSSPTVHLNSKFPSRAASTQINSGEGGEVHKRNSSSLVEPVVHTKPMEVT